MASADGVARISHSMGTEVSRATDSTCSHGTPLSPVNAAFQLQAPSLSQDQPVQTQHATMHKQDSMAANSSSQPQPQPLTFFQKHFTRPDDRNPDIEKESTTINRHFAYTSRGFLTALALATMILFGLIATAVALTVGRHHAKVEGLEGVLPPLHGKPIRLAISSNFPDPALWYENGTWYAFATNNAAGVLHLPGANASANSLDFGQANIQMAMSQDFVSWDLAPLGQEPLPDVGRWATRRAKKVFGKPERLSSTWAPALIKRDDGRYVMYYSAATADKNPYPQVNGHPIHPHPHCIGAAVSETDSPAGPYIPEPDFLACPLDEGGAIDPEAIRDVDGSIWVTWKVDGNNIGHGGSCGNTFKPIVPTPIMIQQMRGDGVTPFGAPIEILDRTEADGPLVEAPAIVRSAEGIYFLFYSSGCTRSPSYAVKYATSDSITGPYIRAKETLLEAGMYGLEAPGSVGIHEDGEGAFMMAFHARTNDTEIGRVRSMWTTKLELTGGKVKLHFPGGYIKKEQSGR